MVSLFDKFVLLMWKHWVATKRQCVCRILELCVTIVLCLMVAFLDSQTTFTAGKYFYPFDISKIESNLQRSGKLAYSPKNIFLEVILRFFCGLNHVEGFDDASQLNKKIAENRSFRLSLEGAILFNDKLKNITSFSDLTRNLEITLRLNFGKELLPVSYNSLQHDYERKIEDFLFLQEKLTLAFIHNGRTHASDLKILMQRFPFPKYLENILSSGMWSVYLFLIFFVFLLRSLFQIREMVIEKERQLKESMKIMGLPAWLYLLAWITISLIISLVQIILMTVILTLPFLPLCRFSNGFVLFLYFFLFACCGVSFSYLMSTLFSKTIKAMVVTIIVFYLMMVPYYALKGDKYNMKSALGASVLYTNAAAYGFYIIGKYEIIGEGIRWENIWYSPLPTEPLCLGPFLIMLILDSILYFVLALYIDAIYPGDFGVPQPWYFPVSRSFWCGAPPQKVGVSNEETPSKHNANIEEVSDNLPVGIHIQNLTKVYGANVVVKNFNLKLYEGQITVLLGHNGAGKSTTMHMITGMIAPSGGTIKVHNYDIRKNLIKARDSMGLCMQHNVYFDDLNVYDHLYFVCKLRNLPKKAIKEEVAKYIKLLGLEGKEKFRPRFLSGGMKRRLCVGMAMCGKPKVVMLDEPTSSLDPASRREVWNLLQEQKQDRTILLITHFMDEADLLGDRIAIMSGGELQCCGSSFFLKKKYGSEYRLILEVTPQCQPNQITSSLKGFIPSVTLHSSTSTELIYKLPESESPKFEVMLKTLENNMSSWKVVSYGITPVSLEEVFLKTGYEAKAIRHEEEVLHKEKVPYVTGWSLVKTQFLAMVLKRSLCIFRSWLFFIITQLVAPILFAVLFITKPLGGLELYSEPENRLSASPISLDSYYQPITVLETDKGNPYAESYRKVLQGYKLEEVDSIPDKILKTAFVYPSRYRKYYLVGASFKKQHLAIAWYNGDYIYAPPLSLSLVYNAYIRRKLGPEYSIKFIDHPLPPKEEKKENDMEYRVVLPSAWTFGTYFAISFYIFFYIREKVCKAKHLQLMCGINVFIFWVVPLIFDLIIYHVTVTALLILTVSLEVHEFQTSEQLSRLAVLLSVLGFFVIPFIHLLSLTVTQPSKGFLVVFGTAIIAGTVLCVVGLIYSDMLGALVQSDDDFKIKYLFIVSPFYGFSKGMLRLTWNYNLRIYCPPYEKIKHNCGLQKICCDAYEEEFYAIKPDLQGLAIIISFALALLSFLLLLLIDSGSCRLFPSKKKPFLVPLEPDVEAEIEKISSTPRRSLQEDYILVFRFLTKYYSQMPAVNGVCLGIKSDECFGLVGQNGAGKTTIFRMTTYETSISHGEIFIAGASVEKRGRKAVELIGYCPQSNALLEELTPRETLRIFALIRGVPWSKCRELSESLAKEFDFFQYLDRKVGELSGGNKRKLSISLALIGDPKILCLDEPTTGIDPSSKRFIWNALTRARERGIPIILSSHDMEECEALCTRACIMIKGNMKCIGSVQRLKSKFAQGFNLTIKIKKSEDMDSNKEAIDRFVKYNFPKAILTETYADMVIYQIPDGSVPYSRIFGILEGNKYRMGLEDYSLGQCTLEQVFLSLMERERNATP